jgi:hypothetical protein
VEAERSEGTLHQTRTPTSLRSAPTPTLPRVRRGRGVTKRLGRSEALAHAASISSGGAPMVMVVVDD